MYIVHGVHRAFTTRAMPSNPGKKTLGFCDHFWASEFRSGVSLLQAPENTRGMLDNGSEFWGNIRAPRPRLA
jgi:hypothetical protein